MSFLTATAAKNDTTMTLIASDRPLTPEMGRMLEGYDCPAILVSSNYEILATNALYQAQFGEIDTSRTQHCYRVSHGYSVPCDQAGEDCPLSAAQSSGHKERVLHIHQTPRGKEHVDVELLPIFDDNKQLICFVELLRAIPTAGAQDLNQTMVGTSKAFNHMLSKITRVSRADASVLLLGESGTGKELAASAIHLGSPRKDRPLVTLECAGLTDSLFESELFGHVKGAFTGAHSNKKGLVEIANNGTLFLDEIGDVPLSMQVKLLRLLESGTYRPVGSEQVKQTHFRLICATHKNIVSMVEQGLFRQDLYYRINVFPIYIPSLRERVDDIPLLANTLIHRISPQKSFYFTAPAMRILKAYPFAGNIRELRNILSRCILLCDTNLLEESTIRESLSFDVQNPSTAVITNSKESFVDLKTAQSQYIQKLMRAYNDDKTKVAKIAGISLRSLYRKLEEQEQP